MVFGLGVLRVVLVVGAAALAVCVALMLVFASRSLVPPPEPGGESLSLTGSQVTGVWRDESGGRLELAADGTFLSRDACGDFSVPADGARSGWTDVTRQSGAGTWSRRPGRGDGRDRAGTEIELRFADGGIWAGYRARGTPEAPFLWTFVGDPNDGELCVLHKADRPS